VIERVRSFVRNARCNLSKSTSQIFMKVGNDVEQVPNFVSNFLEIKVKVQGQNRCTENRLPWFKISSPNLAI